jgi:hypothetical protein
MGSSGHLCLKKRMDIARYKNRAVALHLIAQDQALRVIKEVKDH